MAEKKKKTASVTKDKKSRSKTKKVRTKKQKMIRALFIIAVIFGILLLLAEVILPALSPRPQKEAEEDEDFVFGYTDLGEADKQEWKTMNKNVVYGTYDSVGKNSSVITADTVENDQTDPFAGFWLSYIDSIRNGDEKKYASHYAANCIFDGVEDPYFDGSKDFGEQRIYDIEIYHIINENSATAVGKEQFEVTYKIFRNPGTFRRDIDDWDKTAPYIVTLEKAQSGKYLITKVEYKYKPAA